MGQCQALDDTNMCYIVTPQFNFFYRQTNSYNTIEAFTLMGMA